MPTFNDSNSFVQNVPPGEYKFEVTDMIAQTSKGGKTAGADVYRMVLEVQDHGCRVWENLIDHETCSWKIDVFLKSCGIRLNKGEHFEFVKNRADRLNCRWIDPIGLKGRFKLKLVKKDKGDFNEVEAFIYNDNLPTTAPSFSNDRNQSEEDPEW